ncbi:hypothetical protein PAPYR_1608 [Paratrimastix pyriformis]|uniref:Uncharacterized protein n=1 Tax=Paratrimastix pyriformis TaxID=342808 RepID=A0ABQ8UYS2_9EUKA|nr:hypothetical protein PAPYR_1608 [Paratrimastix pyriformis]
MTSFSQNVSVFQQNYLFALCEPGTAEGLRKAGAPGLLVPFLVRQCAAFLTPAPLADLALLPLPPLPP